MVWIDQMVANAERALLLPFATCRSKTSRRLLRLHAFFAMLLREENGAAIGTRVSAVRTQPRLPGRTTEIRTTMTSEKLSTRMSLAAAIIALALPLGGCSSWMNYEWRLRSWAESPAGATVVCGHPVLGLSGVDG